MYLERVAGIEPASSAWKAAALPLCYTRSKYIVVCVLERMGRVELRPLPDQLGRLLHAPCAATRAPKHLTGFPCEPPVCSYRKEGVGT